MVWGRIPLRYYFKDIVFGTGVAEDTNLGGDANTTGWAHSKCLPFSLDLKNDAKLAQGASFPLPEPHHVSRTAAIASVLSFGCILLTLTYIAHDAEEFGRQQRSHGVPREAGVAFILRVTRTLL